MDIDTVNNAVVSDVFERIVGVGVLMASLFLDILLCEVDWLIQAQRSSLKMTPHPVAVWILPARNECHCWILLYCQVDK